MKTRSPIQPKTAGAGGRACGCSPMAVAARRVAGVYDRLLGSAPLRVKSASSALIAGFGDNLCQNAVEQRESYDFARTARFMLVGGVLVGPTLHAWYEVLATRIPGATAMAAVKRVALDQGVFAPVFVPVFTMSLAAVEGSQAALHDAATRLRKDYVDLLSGNIAIWTPAMFISFWRVPPSYRVLFANIVGIAWNTYASWVIGKRVTA